MARKSEINRWPKSRSTEIEIRIDRVADELARCVPESEIMRKFSDEYQVTHATVLEWIRIVKARWSRVVDIRKWQETFVEAVGRRKEAIRRLRSERETVDSQDKFVILKDKNGNTIFDKNGKEKKLLVETKVKRRTHLPDEKTALAYEDSLSKLLGHFPEQRDKREGIERRSPVKDKQLLKDFFENIN